MPAGATRPAVRPAPKTGADEFSIRLRALGLTPRPDDPWLMVGNPTRVAGWKLHVSATVTGVDALFERALPCLARQRAHFKMAAGRDAIVQLGAGNFGETQIGKVITVYPRNDTQAVALARELIEHTRGIAGPRIATDLHLGEAVYARYGAVRPRIVHDRFGEPTDLIPDGSGNWVPDLRPVPFSSPPGIAIPFPTAAPPHAPTPPPERGLLAGRYFVTDVLRPGIAGSVLRGIDLHDRRRPVACVLKQARPHCSADELGRDRRARLRHEGAVLARLRGLVGVPPAGEYFESEDTGYLPVAYVPGVTLAELVYRLVTGRSWLCVRAQARRRLLGYAAQLVHRLRAAHARGIIHRDVAPTNVWIGDDDRVYLIDWECAHVVGGRMPPFRFGTPGFSDLSRERRGLSPRDDWQACGRVLAFMLTGLDPAAVVHGRPRELATRLAELTEVRDARIIELLARTLADKPSDALDGAMLLDGIASAAHGRTTRPQHRSKPLSTAAARGQMNRRQHPSVPPFTAASRGQMNRRQHPGVPLFTAASRGQMNRRQHPGVPLFTAASHGQMNRRQHPSVPLITAASHESVLLEGLERVTSALRIRLDRLRARRTVLEATMIDAHAGIAGMLYVLAAAHGAGVAHLDTTLGERAVRALTARTPVTPDLPGLVHGRAGRALAVAAAVQSGCVSLDETLRTHLAGALAGRIDWPDFTHGAAGQGFAALAAARRLGVPQLAAGAAACAAHLVGTQNSDGAWTLPEGASGASGKRYTGFAHGAAGMMGFLGTYAALAGDAAADVAWRRAEAWLIGRARRGRARSWRWPQSDTDSAPANWWCHGAPGIALGWLCVAQAQGTAAISEECLRGALEASPSKPRSDSLGQCHGLAGIGEVYLDAYRVLDEECWRERAADIANVLVALCRRRSHQPWHYSPDEPAADADGLMLGTAGILHFLLRHHHPAAVTSAPLLLPQPMITTSSELPKDLPILGP